MASQRPANIDEEDWASVNRELARIGAGPAGLNSTSGRNNGDLASLITAKPEDLGNDANLELLWAEKAFKHAETYFKILGCMKDKKKIKLTQLDDAIYTNFRIHFPASTFPIDIIAESSLKSDSAKTAWRTFCNEYEKNSAIVDFNMGTLLRLDASKDYDQENTTIVPRIQFFAIEIARNREGANDSHGKQ